jgi:glycosyltransferase involved in cell wall biosynthesis
MQILLVVEAFNSVGGVQEIVEHLATYFVRGGHTVAVASRRLPGCLYDGLGHVARSLEGFETTEVDIRNHKPVTRKHLERIFRNPLAARRGELSRLIGRWSPDLVSNHTFNWDTFPAIAAACHYRRTPVVFTLHGFAGAGSLGGRALRALEGARDVITNSYATRASYEQLAPGLRRAHILIGAVDIAAARKARPWPRPRPYIFCPGRLDTKYKSIEAAIEAFRIVAESNPDLDLVLAGDGPDRERVKEMIRRADLAERIEMIGGRSHHELLPLFKGALMSLITGLGLVLLESLAAGTPVVGANLALIPELEEAGAPDFMFAAQGTKQIAESMQRLLDDRELRDKMGAIGQVRAAGFGWDRYAARYLEIFTSCLRVRRPFPGLP